MPITWRSIPILCYHNTCGPDGHDQAQLAAHLDCIRDMGFATLTTREIVDIVTGTTRLKHPAVGITFDDGHVSNWLYALPLLQQRGMRASFFVCSDFISDGPARRTEEIPHLLGGAQSFYQAAVLGDTSQFCTTTELYHLAHTHGMDVLPHSARHAFCFHETAPRPQAREIHWGAHLVYGRDVTYEDLPCPKGGSAYAHNGWWPQETQEGIRWTSRSEQERYRFCREDFARCKTRLEAILKQPLDIFCWPWGEYDQVAERALKDTGFQAALTLERGRVERGTNPMRIGRLSVSPRKSLSWLRSRLRLMRFAPSAGLTYKNGSL